ncbi:MAG: hypothetical protein J0L92_08485 [Deltaproteobacteria bacterium]|nr:hypothetical protein [Deltaproteobacteria bacterium]
MAVPSELILLSVDPDYAIGRTGNLVVVIWVHETRAEAVRHVGEVLRSVARDRGELVGLVQVALPGAKGPEGDAREALIELVRGGKGVIAASAVVYPGEGFLMAAARAFVSGVAMLARPGFPHMVFPTRPEASEWISRLLPKSGGRFWTQRDVVSAIEDTISRVSSSNPRVASLSRT